MQGVHLGLACDLTDDGSALGPRTKNRLHHSSSVALALNRRLCVAADFSPNHPHQSVRMSTMMAEWVAEHYPQLTVVDLTYSCQFNTRGEFDSFHRYANTIGCPIEQRSVSSAWWHIIRAVSIHEEMYGVEVTSSVQFYGVAEDFPFSQRWREHAKIAYLQYPRLRRPLEFAARLLRVRSSY